MSRTPLVELHGVCRDHAGRPVLRHLDLSLLPAQFLVVSGPSGSGKSTLLHLIAGIDRPDRGHIRVLGHALETLSEAALARLRATSIGLVFQAYNLIPTLTAAENIQLPLALNGWSGRSALQRVGELLQRVSLGDRATALPEQLSGGEQQRVALCRALAHRPPLVLADEPTGSLDAETADQVRTLMLEMVREHGSALLVATHSASLAAAADRRLALQQGRLEPEERAC